MRFSKKELKILQKLSSEYKKINRYARYLDEDRVNVILTNGDLYLSDNMNGYMTTKSCDKYTRIIDIFSKDDSKETYLELLENIDGNLKYVGVLKESSLEKALDKKKFKIVREHHQTIKYLTDEFSNQDITLYDLSDLDSKFILDFINENAPDANYTFKEIEKKKFSDFSFYLYGQDVIGVVIALRDNLELYLEQIVIKKSHQGIGLGTKLLKQILFLAKDSQLERVRLHVYKDNFIAYNLYEKFGFKLDKVIAYWERNQWKEKSLD